MRVFFTGPLWLMLTLVSCQYRAQPGANQTNAATPTPPAQVQQTGSTVAAGTHTRDRVSYYTYEVVNTYPHDASAYTQGLDFHNGFLYESTGRNGFSSLRKVELTTGKVLQQHDLAAAYFGEGLTVLQDRIYQLTWQSHKGFIYDLQTFKPVKEFSYRGEGWGLTDDEQVLMLSDGTNQIRFLDSQSYAVKKTINVLDRGMPLSELNELEFIKGVIYANVWQTDQLVQIDPATGKIIGWVNLAGLLPRADTPKDTDGVLNGIAYDVAGDRLFVTGKLWPKLFEIRLKSR